MRNSISRNSFTNWRLLLAVPGVLAAAGVAAFVNRHPQEAPNVTVVASHPQEAAVAHPSGVVAVSAPILISPAEMVRLVVSKQQPVVFSWTQVPGAAWYRLRIFRDPELHTPEYDEKIAATSFTISGLAEGLYYWAVQSIDAQGAESGESGRNRFFVQPHDPELAIELEILDLVQHGHVIQVRGKTQPSANVMVNGQFVPLVKPDGAFDYFTPPLGDGVNTITITAQNSRGGVRTVRRTVNIN